MPGQQRLWPRPRLLLVAMIILTAICIAGAAWTLYWSVRYGLAERAPLSIPQMALRFAIIVAALAALARRRDALERTALLAAVLAAAASVLYGFGLTGTAVRFARLRLHFLAYTLGAVACTRWIRAHVAAGQPRDAAA